MLDQEKFNYFYDLIKTSFITGNYGKPIIPSDYNIFKKLKEFQIPGLYFDFPNIRLNKERTDITEYNSNLLKIKYDFNILFNAINNIITEVNDQFNNSLAERNKVLRELDILEKEIDVINKNPIDPESINYYFTDPFNNVKFIDMERSNNILFNPDNGTIKLDMKNANRINLSHYLGRKGIYFVITSDTSNIISQNNLPNTRFDAMFTESDNDKWIYEIKTSKAIELEGYFTLALNKTGNNERINRIVIEFTNLNDSGNDTSLMTIEYKKSDEWFFVPNSLKSINKLTLEFDFPEIDTTMLRFNFKKTEPDDSNTNTYYIGIKELNIFRSEHKFEGTLVTKPIDINSYAGEDFSIYSAQLETNQITNENTTIDYYVAIDELVDGKIVNIDGENVDIDSPDAYAFTTNDNTNIINGNVESFKIYKSDLRNHYYLSGAEEYENWDPEWLPILPIGKEGIRPDIQFFNTSTEYKDVHVIANDYSAIWSDPRYYGPWPYRGVTWASGAPETGYIFGESVFTAGLVWGKNTFTTGWFRNKPPSSSGTIQTEMFPSYPDFQALGKEFYKIFLWAKNESPIINSVKLFNNVQVARNVKAKWSWNYDEKNIIRKVVLNNVQIDDENYYLIDDNGINARIQMNSVKNVKLLTSKDNLVEGSDYDVHYFYYQETDDEGNVTSYYPVENKTSIDFNKYVGKLINASALGGVSVDNDDNQNIFIKDIYLEYEVEQTEKAISTWNTFIHINKSLINPYILISDENEDGLSLIEKVELTKIDNIGWKLILEKDNLKQKIYLKSGWYKIRIFADAYIDKTNQNYGNAKWNPVVKDNFIMSDGIAQYVSLKGVDMVDFFTLLYDRHAEDDTKASVIKDIDDTSFLVVQKPSIYRFPGYDENGVFQTQEADYNGVPDIAIENKYHYLRKRYNYTNNSYEVWTTGSSGIYTYGSGTVFDGLEPDEGWAPDGQINKNTPNTSGNVWYPNINTFGEIINIHNKNTSGYLFFESGENLESYYNISYRVPNSNKTKRIFLKGEFKSSNNSETPILDEYTLIINKESFKVYEI